MGGNFTIKVSRDGSSIRVEAENFQGESCMSEIKKIIDSLGTVTDEGKKPEFYMTAGNSVRA